MTLVASLLAFIQPLSAAMIASTFVCCATAWWWFGSPPRASRRRAPRRCRGTRASVSPRSRTWSRRSNATASRKDFSRTCPLVACAREFTAPWSAPLKLLPERRGGPIGGRQPRAEDGGEATGHRVASRGRVLDRLRLDVLSSKGPKGADEAMGDRVAVGSRVPDRPPLDGRSLPAARTTPTSASLTVDGCASSRASSRPPTRTGETPTPQSSSALRRFGVFSSVGARGFEAIEPIRHRSECVENQRRRRGSE
jgi:hypothetical protein